jgi:hypothetical protein
LHLRNVWNLARRVAFLFHGINSNEEKGTMTLKTILFGAAAALVLSAGAANAVPATAETSLHVRSGPGTEYEIVGTIPDGGTVDVRGCTGGWCRVAFAGGTGFASRSYLAMAGGPAPSVGVAVVPGYADDDGPYYDDYYDYGYGYGPSVGFSVGVGGRFHHGHRGWRGNWNGGHAWNGGGGNRDHGHAWNGGGRNWSGRTGHNNPSSVASRQGGFAGPPAGWQRPGTGIGAGGAGRSGMAGASAGMRSGGIHAGGGMHPGGGIHAGGGGPAGGGGHVGGGGGGHAGGGFAGSIARH